MLTKDNLLIQDTMPEWGDISLHLYKEFAETILLKRIFRYHTNDNRIIDVSFKEWGIYHMLSIQHIDNRIKNEKFFNEIDNGLDFGTFRSDKVKRARLMDNKDRIRMFSCVYQVLKTGNCFYVPDGKLPNTEIKIDYILYKLIGNKGINIGIRYSENTYVPLTVLVDRAINPNGIIKDLKQIKMKKLEIIEDDKLIETINYNN